MIVDHIENWKAYAFGEAWQQAFSFLEKLDAEAEEKEYPIDGDEIFARVMSYPTKEESDPTAVLEAHRKYVDIQMALIGSERIAVYPTHLQSTKDPYDAERDVTFFHYRKPAALQLSIYPGTFTCLLPQDAHMPQLFTSEPGVGVKKVVVKILLDRLSI
ncbi:YhcH/YjgK/YiaL family protein [Pelagicoccus sp. SDUM812003]|uniref:YhcH/YjgK/YiaL family protein n=1 Tax=Pelagicoccus sp. SDUM812003 TaxID=3041267 RepID=UPI0028105093|nr:YhcH/YjgK/YiaL family protein [Pelagicoccus sp. SDUM812003]MDQ8202664.1 YhcH/YjgK/YiaL family protein [Pelagicoccus sp. SDUM812003]